MAATGLCAATWCDRPTLHAEDDDWTQAGTLVRNVLNADARDRLVGNSSATCWLGSASPYSSEPATTGATSTNSSGIASKPASEPRPKAAQAGWASGSRTMRRPGLALDLAIAVHHSRIPDRLQSLTFSRDQVLRKTGCPVRQTDDIANVGFVVGRTNRRIRTSLRAEPPDCDGLAISADARNYLSTGRSRGRHDDAFRSDRSVKRVRPSDR